MNKTGKAIGLLRQGKFPEALAIIVKFSIGFTKDEKRTLEIAHESLTGNSSFYESIGIDTGACVIRAEEIIRNKYNIKM